MSLQIYAGNLSYAMKDESLKELFEQYGDVSSVKIIRYRDSGRSKGYGFVDMINPEAAEKAIAELNGTDVEGRSIRVNRARPKVEGTTPVAE